MTREAAHTLFNQNTIKPGKVNVTTTDIDRMKEMRKLLTAAGNKESSFIKVEMLFYEALEISRSYGNDPGSNELLAKLKELEMKEYENTKAHYKKSSQREKAIQQFTHRLKNILANVENIKQEQKI